MRPGREGAVPPGVDGPPGRAGRHRERRRRAGRRGARARSFHLAGAASVGRSFAEPRRDLGRQPGRHPRPCSRRCARTRPRSRRSWSPAARSTARVPLDALPVGAETPLNPVSPYGASKAAADLATAQYRAAYGLPAFRVRAFNQIGPGQDARFVLPNVARQIARAERDGLPEVRGARGERGHAPRLHGRARHGARLLAHPGARRPRRPLPRLPRRLDAGAGDHRGARAPSRASRSRSPRTPGCGARGSSPTSMVRRTGSGRTRAGRPRPRSRRRWPTRSPGGASA